MRPVILVLLIVPLVISLGYLATHPMPKDNAEALRALFHGPGEEGQQGQPRAAPEQDWRLHVFDHAPKPGDPEVPEGRHVRIETDRGSFVIELYPEDAPGTVANFKALAARGFYDGLTFHRVIPRLAAEAGDPKGDGTGGPGYHIRAESNRHRHVNGAVVMARDRKGAKDSSGSRFYIVYGAHPRLDGYDTVFGRVVRGMDVVDRITRGTVMRKVTVLP